jgi:hypothetical protein
MTLLTARAAAIAVLAVAALTTAACGADDEPGGAPSTTTTVATPSETPSATPSDAGAPTEEPAPVPFPADTAEDRSDSSAGAALTVTGVTTGQHDGYDRVVFELAGTGTPGWIAAYVDQAVDDPQDDVLDLAGDAVLQVVLTGLQMPEGAAPQPAPLLTPDYAVLREVNLRGWFEGQQSAFLGLAEAGHPFRVFALTDPTRVVVDVRHDG